MPSQPKEFTDKVLDMGIWHKDNDQLVFKPEDFTGNVENSHKFGFTPEPVTLAPETIQQMVEIGEAIPDYYQMLQDLGKDLPAVGTSSQYKGIEIPQWSPPPVTMIDAMITADKEVKIAEVDVINPRGLGYLAMYELLHEPVVASSALNAIGESIEDSGSELTILYGALQGFYKPYFDVLKSNLGLWGIESNLVAEGDIVEDENGTLNANAENWSPKLLLDFPILKKKNRKTYGQPSKTITDRYNSGELKLLYPPQQQLASKLLLANAYDAGMFGDKLPETVVSHDATTANQYLETGQYCIKAAISSGMKGLWMPGSRVTGNVFPVVAQKLVDNQDVMELTYASGNDKSWERGKFLARLSLFVGSDGALLGADITAQPYSGKTVGIHGSPDCVLAPVQL